MVGFPEFQDLAKMKDILRALEEKEHILEIINRHLEEKIQIYIGSEIAYQDINGCSLAVSSFKKVNGPSGRIAVLGPTRMDYERVVSALKYFSKLVSEIL